MLKPEDRPNFFRNRLGNKLESLIKLLETKPAVLFFLAKKNAGKGTYSKLLNEVTGDRIAHISVGDLVREAGQKIKERADGFMEEVMNFYYRYVSEDELKKLFEHGASQTKNLLPTDAIVALIKRAIHEAGGKAAIIDGFPRAEDQVDLAIKMKEDFNEKGIPSAFVEIDCADEILLARLMNRRICPECQTPKHMELLLTKEIECDQDTGEFHLICDNKECKRVRMVRKQGDTDGPDVIKERQRQMAELFGLVKEKAGGDYLRVRNHIPVSDAHNHDHNDFTTSATLAWDPEKGEVVRNFDKWVVIDEKGSEVYSRWPEPVVADLANELHDWLHRQSKEV